MECRPSIVWRKIGQQGPREVARGNALFEVVMMMVVIVMVMVTVVVAMVMLMVVEVILFLGDVGGTTRRRYLCLFGL